MTADSDTADSDTADCDVADYDVAVNEVADNEVADNEVADKEVADKEAADKEAADQAPRLFGTDGIRGRFGVPPLDRSTVTRLGATLARRLAGDERPVEVVVGGDTRASTPTLAAWLAEGLTSAGAGVRFAGTLPTPAIGWAVRELGAAAGVAVSASHNPPEDNGIKLVDAEGHKWSAAAEADLERSLARAGGVEAREAAALEPEPEILRGYLAALAAQLEGEHPLAGLRVVLDTGHGAASGLAAELFAGLGADVVALGDSPDGTNINRGFGSTAPERMAAATVARGADLGFAFDGDADRAIVADETGQIHDGDAILFLWARALSAGGELDPPRIVATSMSNLGLQVALEPEGIEVIRCDVGDRAVVETLRQEGLLLGGEQAGHIVHLGYGATGDGLQTALHLAAIVRDDGRPLSAQLAGFRRFPQILVNVPVRKKPELLEIPAVAEAAREIETALGERGRLVLRYSGTEPLARVMIEGPEREAIETHAGRLARLIEHALG